MKESDSCNTTNTTNNYVRFTPAVKDYIHDQIFGEAGQKIPNNSFADYNVDRNDKWAKSVIKVIEIAYNNGGFQVYEIRNLHINFAGSLSDTLDDLKDMGVLICFNCYDDDYEDFYYAINPFLKQQIESKIRVSNWKKNADKNIAEQERLGVQEQIHNLYHSLLDNYREKKSIIITEARKAARQKKSDSIHKDCIKAVDEMHKLFGNAA